ncbi:efflux RND transporter periplasmic adaptor subunit [Anoxynatronum sibiricum]|uniref:Biotin/lipoyl-binding protein n=1 Tax=Anoxynatronum sibiricum TaxID=210623 RepID=A0ABU9VS36_9CLOT
MKSLKQQKTDEHHQEQKKVVTAVEMPKAKHTTKRKRRSQGAGWWLLLLIVLTTSACSQSEAPLERVDRRVTVMELRQETAPLTLHFTGEVVAQELRQISFPVSGRIEALHVAKEMPVEADTLLGNLDDTDYRIALEGARAQLRSVQSQLDLALAGALEEELLQAELEALKAEEATVFAQAQLGRSEALFEAGAVSQLELDAARLEAALAAASFQQVEQQLTRLRAGARQEEIDGLAALRDAAAAEVTHVETQMRRAVLQPQTRGIITALHYETGETYVAGTPLLTLRSDIPKVQVSATVGELALLQPGNPAVMVSRDLEWAGEISLISTFPDPLTRTYPIDISYQEAGHLPGTVVSVVVETTPVTGIWVPMSSVVAGDQDYVYVVAGDVAVQIPVNVVQSSGTRLMITGVEPGQMLVIAGMSRLSSGDRVIWEAAGDQP